MTTFADYGEYAREVIHRNHLYSERNQLVAQMASAPRPILTRGYCACCRQRSDFTTDADAQGVAPGATPNWREGQACSECGLSSRMRASIHLMQYAVRPDAGTRIYLTEQVTALYHWVKRRHPRSVGSEYLRDGTPRGRVNAQGVRHEDLTALSFADETFDLVVSLEVMEHIPDFHRAFAECVRVLVPGGRMLLSVPFHRGPTHLLRARVRDDGSIEHLQPPEYHGDPQDPQGCLCFHHFGWDILDLLKQAGFRQATAYSIWSQELGYVASGGEIILFIAVK
jgi:Methyltransferase domain